MLRLSKKALIVGGNSQFGKELVKEFSKKWQVTSVDTSENKTAHKNLLYNLSEPLTKTQ